jgi:hypothetical protein
LNLGLCNFIFDFIAMRKLIGLFLLFFTFQIPAFLFADGNRDMRSFRIVSEKRKVKPGESIKIEFEVKRKNGRGYTAGHSEIESKHLWQKQQWADFEIEIQGGKIEKGILTVSKDIRLLSNQKTVELIVTHKVLKKQQHKLSLPVDFNGDNFFHFDGVNGKDGKKGLAGVRMLMADAVDGNPGVAGENGTHAEDLIIYVKRDTSFKNDTMLRVYIKLPKKDTSLIIFHNIQRYKLTFTANGGKGGDGGNGGRGSGGRMAKAPTSYTFGQPAGNGGNGGNGGGAGNGGDAGSITVYLENDILQYKSKIVVENNTGSAGIPGKGGEGGSGGMGNVFYPSGQKGSNGQNGSEGTEGKKAEAPKILSLDKFPFQF